MPKEKKKKKQKVEKEEETEKEAVSGSLAQSVCHWNWKASAIWTQRQTAAYCCHC